MSRAAVILTAFAAAALLSFVGTAFARRWSIARGFVDKPGGHKGHASPVALGGGVAVVLAIVLPMLAGLLAARLWVEQPPSWLPEAILPHLAGIVAKSGTAIGIIAASLALCIMGLIDDIKALSAKIKLLCQIAIALFLVVGLDLRILSHLPWALSAGLSAFWIITLTNSLNFLDNMDGLTSGVAMIAAAIFATTAMLAGQIFVPVCCWLLAGALAGFLPHNFHPARIFLGDAGSQVIGMLLGVFTILTTFADPAQGQQPIGVIAPLIVMAVPLYDTASVVFLRLRLGVPIWTGDRRHFSHRLVRRGMGVRKAVLVIWLATLVTSLPALLLPTASWLLAAGVVAQTLLVVCLVALLESAGKDV